MEKEKGNKFLLVLVILSIGLLLGLAIFFIINKLKYGDISVQETKKYGNEGNTVKISKDKELNNIKLLLEDDYFINLVSSNSSYEDITNEKVLNYVINNLIVQSQYQLGEYGSIIKEKDINKFLESSLMSNYTIKHNNIHYLTINGFTEQIVWEYNNGIYKKIVYPHGEQSIIPIFKHLDNYTKSGNTYTLSYKYAFTLISEGDSPNLLYGTYKDTINKTNVLYTSKMVSINYDEIKDDGIKYINNNYELLKDKMTTYNYVVEVNNKQIVLRDFYVS